MIDNTKDIPQPGEPHVMVDAIFAVRLGEYNQAYFAERLEDLRRVLNEWFSASGGVAFYYSNMQTGTTEDVVAAAQATADILVQREKATGQLTEAKLGGSAQEFVEHARQRSAEDDENMLLDFITNPTEN